ncbi:hypothetical protein O6H91_03G104600 [Diphasiastrum complanatum]|uniref:Uncharacterized protein n=1 Tax=Diphasiastrum complanatum TaxID=34168 RepID=A0ACC2E9Z9_DIPCM|nr:hypothetical protein O6H91_03G104600 [Diphasiastrum complanatum]
MGVSRASLFSPLSHRALISLSSSSSSSSSSILCFRRVNQKSWQILRSASSSMAMMVRADRDQAPDAAAEASCVDSPSSASALLPNSVDTGPAATDAASSASAAGSAASAIQFLTLCQRLKTTKRAGWINHGVEHSESIADHMYRMAVMAIITNDVPGVNKDRCVKMAIVHDIAEAIVGDITPADGVPKEEKSRRERAAIDDMCNMLGKGFSVDELRELWNEYETNASPEAKLVKDFDKVEMILQALEYESAQGKDLDDFFRSTAGKFQTDVGRAWAGEIIARRNRPAQLS